MASTGLAGGLRPDFMGQVSTLQKPQAPFTGFLAAAAQGLTRTLSASGESLGRNSGMEVGRRRGRICCAAGRSPFTKHVASIDNSLVLLGKWEPWRWPGPLESVLWAHEIWNNHYCTREKSVKQHYTILASGTMGIFFSFLMKDKLRFVNIF